MGWLRRLHERRSEEERDRELLAIRKLEWARCHSVNVLVKPNGRVSIDVLSYTDNGFEIPDGPPLTLDSLDDAQRLGEAILAGLALSNRAFLPERNLRTEPIGGELLEWRRVKTWAQYVRHVRSVSVRAEYDAVVEAVRITPERNEGRTRFTPVPGGAVTITYESPAQLGRAVQEAMDRATTV